MTTPNQSEQDRQIEQDARAGHEFSLAELIGREGGDFLKGESPIPKLVQASTEINRFIVNHLSDSSGCLQSVLQTWVTLDEAKVSQHLDDPLRALEEMIISILENEQLLYELVKQVDFRWGQLYQEKPYFQQPGQPAHPDDEYTHESVYESLSEFLHCVRQ
ncbi:hypothetical protein PN466_11815 [Roseofilum reptotaenium CS-1145]|uniref:Uncharacterized protein n=1 Tax=Roseofilum reptotaenium AO1-A TaxID=1925591 RepID=A0A1L9QMT1_9CYAN|nr:MULTISPECIES: hypothetical protein [Roseofilum]MBP0030169.1 hypothetical protein [Roseofilum sp. Guam]MDB9517635.1 hypothetical protein [Roseofilum reptotaenium CS-1145]OJJ22699.1 hypothetical protein BI308_19275 [Roseofilum reptotaenium AO1-A]